MIHDSGLGMVFYHVQLRTYCKDPHDLWTSEGHCSLHRKVQPKDTSEFRRLATQEVTPTNEA
jgi:hypothetical protein